MSGDVRNTPKTGRWRSLLRAGAVAAALAVVASVPLAAQAHDGHRGDHRGDWGRHHGGWHGGPHHPHWAYGPRYVGPRYVGPRYYAPAYGYYAPGYYAPAPGVGLNFVIR